MLCVVLGARTSGVWGATPRPEDESGQVTMFIKSKPDRPADCTMVVVPFAAKSTHNCAWRTGVLALTSEGVCVGGVGV